MSTRYVYFNPTINLWEVAIPDDGQTYKLAQTFVLYEGMSNYLTSFKLKVLRSEGEPNGGTGILSVAVRLSNASDEVIGDDLSTGTYDYSGLSYGVETEIEIPMSPHIFLSHPDQFYYVVLFGSTLGPAGDYLVGCGKYLPQGYGAGKMLINTAGVWAPRDPEADFWFEEWGVVLATDTTDPASSIGKEEATINGTLNNDGGEACDCGFEWGETPAYGNTTPTQSRTTGQTFSQVISGLDPAKTYHFRAFATNAGGTAYGADQEFDTLKSGISGLNPVLMELLISP